MPSAPPARVKVGGARLQRLLIPSEPGLESPPSCCGRRARFGASSSPSTTAGRKPWPRTRSSRGPARGWAVCGVDPRASENRRQTRPAGYSPSAFCWVKTSSAARPGTSAGCSKPSGPPSVYAGKPVGLYARGEVSCLAATYAIARASDPGKTPLRWYLLRDGFLSYRAFIERPRSLPAVLPAAAR